MEGMLSQAVKDERIQVLLQQTVQMVNKIPQSIAAQEVNPSFDRAFIQGATNLCNEGLFVYIIFVHPGKPKLEQLLSDSGMEVALLFEDLSWEKCAFRLQGRTLS